MQAWIFRAQLTTGAALDNLPHGPQRHIGRLCRNGAFCLREALIQYRAIFGNHRTQRGKLCAVKPPLAMVWKACATSIGVRFSAPRIIAGTG